MKELVDGRRGPQKLDENETTRYLAGTPQHLLLEATRSTRAQVNLWGMALNILDKTVHFSTPERRDRFDLRDLREQVFAIDQGIFERLRASQQFLDSRIVPPKRSVAIKPIIPASFFGESVDSITIEEYYATRTGIDAFTVMALRELEPYINKMEKDILRSVKTFCDYSRVLFFSLIPGLEQLYNCSITTVEVRRVLTLIKSGWEKLVYTQSEPQLFGTSVSLDYLNVVNAHKNGSILAMIDETLSAITQTRQHIISLKRKHPENIDCGTTPIHMLFHNAGLLCDELMSVFNGMKTSNGLEKTGFSYVCDKITEDFRTAYHGKEVKLIRQEKRRASLDGFYSEPTPPIQARPSGTSEELHKRVLTTRIHRGRSIDGALVVSLPSSPLPKRPVSKAVEASIDADRADAKSQVRSLTRTGPLARLFSAAPQGQSQKLSVVFEQGEDEIDSDALRAASEALLAMEEESLCGFDTSHNI